MDTNFLTLIGIVFLLAGLVKGISGMGLPTVSMALLCMMMSPAGAATLMVVPSLITNVAQCAGPYWRSLARRLWPMWAGLVLLTLFSPFPDLGTSSTLARLALGMILAIYGLWGLTKPALPDFGRYALAAGGVAGALSGILTAATGVFVVPLVPYLQSQGLSKDELIQALGLSFMLATLTLMARLGSLGAAVPSLDAVACVIATLTAFAGLWGGAALRSRLQPAQFQRALYWVLLSLGIAMVGRSL